MIGSNSAKACATNGRAPLEHDPKALRKDFPGSSAIMAIRFRPVALRRCFSTALPFRSEMAKLFSANHMPA